MTMAKIDRTADPRVQLARMMGGTISAPAASAAFDAPAELQRNQRAADQVKAICHETTFGEAFANALDNDGMPSPGRMLMQLNRLTLPGDGMKAWKTPGGQVETEFIGVPIRIAPYRVFWGGGDAPKCGSIDRINGFGEPGGNCERCTVAEYKGAGIPRCADKTRLYLAGAGTTMTVMDLTAMPRQGLAPLEKWAKREGYDLRQLLIKFWLDEHPRQMPDSKFKILILRSQVLGVADDGTSLYRERIMYANQVLDLAERSWLADITSHGGNEPTSTTSPNAEWGGYNVLSEGEAEIPYAGQPATSPEPPPLIDVEDMDESQLPF